MKMNKAEGAAPVNDLGIAAFQVSRDGKHRPFKMPCNEDAFLKAPKAPQSLRSSMQLSRHPRKSAQTKFFPAPAQAESCAVNAVYSIALP